MRLDRIAKRRVNRQLIPQNYKMSRVFSQIYSHRFHLKNQYGRIAAITISAIASG